MTRIFIRENEKTYLDQNALLRMAQETLIGIDDLYEIFGVNQNYKQLSLIEV